MDDTRVNKPASRISQLADRVLDAIRSGEYQSGDQLPTEHALAERYGVSRASARAALGMLADRGFVYRLHGHGTFVSRRSAKVHTLNEAVSFGTMLSAQGLDYEVRVHDAAVVAAGLEVASALDLESPDAPVLRFRKSFLVGAEAYMHNMNAVPVVVIGAEAAERACRDHSMLDPLDSLIESHSVAPTAYVLATLEPVAAPLSGYEELAVEAGTPFIKATEVGWTEKDRPIWHSVEFHSASPLVMQVMRIKY